MKFIKLMVDTNSIFESNKEEEINRFIIMFECAIMRRYIIRLFMFVYNVYIICLCFFVFFNQFCFWQNAKSFVRLWHDTHAVCSVFAINRLKFLLCEYDQQTNRRRNNYFTVICISSQVLHQT